MAVQGNFIITGGSNGIGRAMVLRAARELSSGNKIVFVGSRDPEKIKTDAALLALVQSGQATYIQCDVANPLAIASTLRNGAEDFFGNSLKTAPLHLVASAGIARSDKDAAEVSIMVRINLGGTVNLLDTFNRYQSPGSTFTTLGSIVRLRALPGNQTYAHTKEIVEDLAAASTAMPNIAAAICVVPGLIDTRMTQEEPAFPMLGVDVVKAVATHEALRSGLASFLGIPEDKLLALQSGDRLIAILARAGFELGTETLTRLEVQPVSDTRIPVDEKTGKRLARFAGKDVAEGKIAAVAMGVLRDDPQMKGALAGALKALDILVAPEVVADRWYAQLETGKTPEHGILEVYSEHGQDPILQFFA